VALGSLQANNVESVSKKMDMGAKRGGRARDTPPNDASILAAALMR
jgi:hypothetical protein